MSDSAIQAISSIIGALIGAFGSIVTAKIQVANKANKESLASTGKSNQFKMSVTLFIFITLLSGIAGFILGTFYLSRDTSRVLTVEALLPNITGGPGGIQRAFPWWNEYSNGGSDGVYNPSALPGWPGCYGIAWNVIDFSDKVIVFQRQRDLKFQPGGWYVQVCVPREVNITAYDIGKIQATWLAKEYGVYWDVEILP